MTLRRPLSPSARAQSIKPTLIRALRAGMGPETIDFGLGQTDLPVSEAAARGAAAVLRHGTRAPYTPNAGLGEARAAVAAHVGCAPDQVMLTCGVQEALAVSLLGLVEPGDEVLVPDPGFPAYANLVRACGATPVAYPLVPPAASGEPWGLYVDAIAERIGPSSRLIILNNPSNPTGTVHSGEELGRLARLIERHDLAWLEDAIYEDYLWSGVFTTLSALESMQARGVRVSGLSKSHHVMGWRIGWMVAPAETIAALTPLHQHLVTCAPLPAQLALIEALKTHREAVADACVTLAARRQTVQRLLSPVEGLGLSAMQGAFYAFVDVRPWLGRFASSRELAEALLAEQDVLVIPGEGFGDGGQGFLRIAYTVGEPQLSEGLSRLTQFLEAYRL
ncbi:pyridoxal phosphate-dependent aminotransferase [Bradymonadaceae bacterium TMQ3]|nr:pyridoxal phosphate-dependent aminotransferase [Bradymonadaceae bacterium TMQ3]TXC77234.1 pyridoxal phosphate-dependent aminotransferase [Bradymonadales bacterium TMQ1]